MQSGKRPPNSRRLNGRLFFWIGLGPALLVGLYAYRPLAFKGPPLCVFKNVTGVPCPGCGLTRATCSLLHGEVATSLRMHQLALPVLAYLGILWLGKVAVHLGAAWKPETTISTGILLAFLLGYHSIRLVEFFASGAWGGVASQCLVGKLFALF